MINEIDFSFINDTDEVALIILEPTDEITRHTPAVIRDPKTGALHKVSSKDVLRILRRKG